MYGYLLIILEVVEVEEVDVLKKNIGCGWRVRDDFFVGAFIWWLVLNMIGFVFVYFNKMDPFSLFFEYKVLFDELILAILHFVLSIYDNILVFCFNIITINYYYHT